MDQFDFSFKFCFVSCHVCLPLFSIADFWRFLYWIQVACVRSGVEQNMYLRIVSLCDVFALDTMRIMGSTRITSAGAQ